MVTGLVQGGYRVVTGWVQGGYRVGTGWVQGGHRMGTGWVHAEINYSLLVRNLIEPYEIR